MPYEWLRKKYVDAGRCRSCGRPREEGHTRCRICLDNKKRYKQRLSDQGRCRICGLPLIMGETAKTCRNCSEEIFTLRW